MTQGRTFVGFGFGPIQSGLFLFEAWSSGNFTRYVVAEVDAAVVEAVRANGGRYTVNIARRDRIDQLRVVGIELYNPAVSADRCRLIEAIAESQELATALPSVRFYSGPRASPAMLIAEGLARRPRPLPTVIYAAENHNHAAEMLSEAVFAAGGPLPQDLDMLNTVIGKMSGVITEPATIARLGLATVTPTLARAILVEEFNRILVSRVTLPVSAAASRCFVEKDDLLPFEEAKLYGHNAIHALIAYLADLKGMRRWPTPGHDEWLMPIAREAFIDESGGALIEAPRRARRPALHRRRLPRLRRDLLDRMVRPT